MKYHLARGEEQLGTFNDLDVSAGLRSGKFLPTDLCWADGMKEWETLRAHLNSESEDTNADTLASVTALREEIRQDNRIQETKLASLWQRLFAYLVDLFMLLTPIVIILTVVVDAAFEAEVKASQNNPTAVMEILQRKIEQMQASGNVTVMAMSWLMIAVVITNVVLLTIRGQSIGKLLVGIQIVRFPDGSKAGFIKVILLRGLLFGIIGNIQYIGPVLMIANVLLIFRADRRCLHDWVADTQVIQKKRD